MAKQGKHEFLIESDEMTKCVERKMYVLLLQNGVKIVVVIVMRGR